MAQRATVFAKKPDAAKAGRSDGAVHPIAKTPAAQRAIPLELAPLLSPYKKKGRLSVRIESLHRLARLSAGRNNGDGSWSLAPDELEDLDYLLPEGVQDAHSLAIRIIGVSGGSTLAVLDFPVPMETRPAPVEPVAANVAADAVDDIQLRRLGDEVAALKSALATRDIELSKAREDAERAAADSAKWNIESELAQARIAWKTELDERLTTAAACAAAELARSREAWSAERDALSSEAERREQACLAKAHEQWQSDAQDALAKAERAWQTAAEARLALAEAKRHEAQDALSKAEQVWKAEAAARLVTADLQWQEKSASVAAQARAEAESARDKTEDELRRINSELSSLRATLADRESALARAGMDTEQARHHWEQETSEAIAKAEQAWKSDAAARLAMTDAQWQAKFESALALMRAEADAARVHSDEEGRHLREQCATFQAVLAERESTLARSGLDSEQARSHWQQATQEALTKAEESWNVETAVRFAMAEEQWREKSESALAQMRAEAQAEREQNQEVSRRLREEMAALQAALADREAALARVGSDTDRTRNLQRETGEALVKAEAAWKAKAEARLAAVEARWQKVALAAVAQAFAEAHAERGQDDEVLRRLREDMSALQAALADREAALVRAHADAESLRERLRSEAQDALSKAEEDWKAEAAVRLALAEVQWKESAADAVARAQAETGTVRAECEDALRRLREEMSALHTSLAAREAAVTAAQSGAEQTCARLQREGQEALAKAEDAWKTEATSQLAAAKIQWQEKSAKALADARALADAALSKAKATWKIDETARLAAAEAQWRKKSAGALADATARYEAAETALARQRIGGKTAQGGNDTEINRLYDELAGLRRDLAAREIELTQLRSRTDSSHEHAPETQIVIQPNRAWAEADSKQDPVKRGQFRGLVVAASLTASVIAIYPSIAPHLPEGVQENIATVADKFGPLLARNRVLSASLSASLPDSGGEHTATVARDANVRSGPSGTAAIVLTLPRGSDVATAELRGSWVLVRFGKSQSQQGWVYRSYLKLPGEDDKIAPAENRK